MSVEQVKDQCFFFIFTILETSGQRSADRNASDDHAVAAAGAPILQEKRTRAGVTEANVTKTFCHSDNRQIVTNISVYGHTSSVKI